MVDAVRSRRAFSALSRSRHRGRSGPVWIVRAASDDGRVRVAYAVSRSIGTAVVRNRVRRRLRAVMDELDRTGRLEPGLYLVGVRPQVTEATYDELRRHCVRALPSA